MGGQRYVDLGLGTHRVKCRVHEDFKYDLKGYLLFYCTSREDILDFGLKVNISFFQNFNQICFPLLTELLFRQSEQSSFLRINQRLINDQLKLNLNNKLNLFTTKKIDCYG